MSFIYPFTKYTILCYITNDLHKKVLVSLCYALSITRYHTEQINKLSTKWSTCVFYLLEGSLCELL